MHWKHGENNVKNCINIDLIDLASHMEFFKLFSIYWHRKEINNIWSLLFSKKIPLSCFYMQLQFDNYEHNCPAQVPSEIL